MKLPAFLKKIDAKKTKQAKALISKIRELEEEKAGRFIAFVDDGDLSHDVSVEIDPKSLELKKYLCDCDLPAPCTHILAVMTNMVAGKVALTKSKAVKRIKKKKLNKIEQLMLELDEHKVVEWLEKELQSNKELLVKFEIAFGQNDLDISPAAILNNYETSKKAVIGRKRSLALNKLPQLLDLLKLYHEAVIDKIKDQLDRSDSLNAVIAIEEVCGLVYFILQKHTTRVATYCKKLFVPLDRGMELLDDDRLSNLIENPLFYQLSYELIFRLTRSCHTRLSVIQKQHIIDKIYAMDDEDDRLPFREIALDFVEFITDIDALDANITKLPIFSWDHKYNTQILERAVEMGEFDFVINNCELLINSNAGYYALPYIEMADAAFEQRKGESISDDRKNLHLYAMNTCPNEYSFKYLYDNHKDILDLLVKKVDSIRLMPNTKKYKHVLKLKFGMWILLKKFDKLLKKVNEGRGFWEATLHEDVLLKNRKSKYLSSLVGFLDHIWDEMEKQKHYTYIQNLIPDVYSEKEAEEIIDSCSVYDRTNLMLKEHLGMVE